MSQLRVAVTCRSYVSHINQNLLEHNLLCSSICDQIVLEYLFKSSFEHFLNMLDDFKTNSTARIRNSIDALRDPKWFHQGGSLGDPTGSQNGPRGPTIGTTCWQIAWWRDVFPWYNCFFVFIRIYDGFSFVVVYDHYPRIGWHNLLLEDTATSPL
jgi:hypothetical protein